MILCIPFNTRFVKTSEVRKMRIPAISNQTVGFQYLDGYRNTENSAKPVDSGPGKSLGPDSPENRRSGQADKLSYTPDGDILDFDWNRIRRFVQRFAWDTEPPESIRDIRDFWDKYNSNPVFSWDGDKAEFNFKPPENYNKTYGSEGASKAAPPEPKGKCSTCESRRYVDKSDDSSVSYQTPTKLSPGTAALAVGAHEREHVFNERANAKREGREIVNQTVSIKYGICPECHRMYPTGGVTRTQSVKVQDKAPDPKAESKSPSQGSPPPIS